VTDLIPMVGATIGAVVCIAVALLATRLWPTTVLLAAFFVAYQQLENYVLAPRIMRRPVQLSLAAVLLAGRCWGADLRVWRGPVTPGAGGCRWVGRARHPELAAIERLALMDFLPVIGGALEGIPTVLSAAAHLPLCGQVSG
jgi:predicted PurR-regulated permease PerM